MENLDAELRQSLEFLRDEAFVSKPEEIDRLLIRFWPDGRLYFKGSRRRIDEFLQLCAELGLEVQVDHISLCG